MEKNVYFCKIIPTVEPLDNMQFVPRIKYRCILSDMHLDFRWKEVSSKMVGDWVKGVVGFEMTFGRKRVGNFVVRLDGIAVWNWMERGGRLWVFE